MNEVKPMARKSWMYSVLEAVQFEMREDPAMLWKRPSGFHVQS